MQGSAALALLMPGGESGGGGGGRWGGVNEPHALLVYSLSRDSADSGCFEVMIKCILVQQ